MIYASLESMSNLFLQDDAYRCANASALTPSGVFCYQASQKQQHEPIFELLLSNNKKISAKTPTLIIGMKELPALILGTKPFQAGAPVHVALLKN